MGNRWKKWFAVVMATVLGMPGYGLMAEHIQTKAEDGSVTIHVESEERHVQVNETISLIDGISVEGPSENGESYRVVVRDVQEQDSGLSLYEEGMEEFSIPQEAAGKTYRVLYQAQSSMDNETWNDVEGSEKETLLVVEQEEEPKEVEEETSEEESKEEETPQPKTVTLQGQEREEAEVGEVFSFLHEDNVIIHHSQEDTNTYRIVVRGVDTPENGSYQYQEGDESFVPQKSDEGLTYIIHYGVDIHKDDESHDNQWGQVEGVSFDKEVIITDKVIIQGEEEITVLAGEEYNFIHDSGLVVKGAKEEGTTYRLKVKGVKSPAGGSYSYQEGDESFTPKESDESLIYEVTYGVETSKDQTTWEEVDKVQFTQKIITAVFRAEPVRGPLATEAILCKGQSFHDFVANWNSGSAIQVKNLVKADVPSDLMTATLRYKYETISDPSSPVKIYMWHDMSAVGQYTDTVYFGTEVPGVTIYTNPDARKMFCSSNPWENKFAIEKIYDSANPSTPYFFNTSKTTDMSYMFSGVHFSSTSIPFDCTNGSGVSPFGLMDMSSVTDASSMFSGCNNLNLSGIESWNMSHVTNISRMFAGCENMDASPIVSWDVHNVTDISYFFSGVENSFIIPWGIGNWHFDNLQNVYHYYYHTHQDIHHALNFTNWDFSHTTQSATEFIKSETYYKNTSLPSKIGIGPTMLNANGEFMVHYPKENAWKNVATNDVYFHGEDPDSSVNQVLNDFPNAYKANPTGMSGTYVPTEEYYAFNYFINYSMRTAYYKKNQLGTTVSTAPEPDPTEIYAGQIFKGWKSGSTGITYQANQARLMNGNDNLSAVLELRVYHITYDLDGGVNAPGNPATFTAPDQNTNIIVENPSKPGKIFAGWASEDDQFENKAIYRPVFPLNWMHPKDIKLIAKWSDPVTVTVHGMGATEDGSGNSISTITLPKNVELTIDGELPYSGSLPMMFSVWQYSKYTYSSEYEFYTKQWTPGAALTGAGKTYKYLSFDAAGTQKFADLGGHRDYVTLQHDIDVYIQWRYPPKQIHIVGYNKYYDDAKVTEPGGTKLRDSDHIEAPSGEQWDQDSPNVTVSLEGHTTGASNEYVLSNFTIRDEDIGGGVYVRKIYYIDSFKITAEPGSAHTYPTGDLTSYTFTGGFDKDVTITLKLGSRVWPIQYLNTDDTPITAKQMITEADLPYTFRNTYPPHAPWNGFPVLPIGWTINKYNTGTPAEGIYTQTGNLPTLYRGTWDATQFNTITGELKLYPLYSVDVNKDGIPDLFQNKNTLTVSKEVKSEYSDLSSMRNKVFPYEITFNDVHGDPIKNWPIQDTNGNNYTTDNSGKVTINLKHGESISFQGMLPNMILRAVETDSKGLYPEYAISYNGTSFTSGSDTGNVTYQDNTPLTFAFRNTDTRTIVPAGIKDTNTRVYVLLAAVLIALLFSIRMLKRRRHA